MKFEKKWLQNLIHNDVDDGEVVENKIVKTSRWSIHHEIVFKYNERFFETQYSTASTEAQDERPFDYNPDNIEWKEVFLVEKMVTVYE